MSTPGTLVYWECLRDISEEPYGFVTYLLYFEVLYPLDRLSVFCAYFKVLKWYKFTQSIWR